MLTYMGRAAARRVATSPSLPTRFSALAIRSIAVRSFSAYQSPLLAPAKSDSSSTSTKSTASGTKKKPTEGKKSTKKPAKKPAKKEPVAIKPKKKKVVKILTPEQQARVEIKELKKQALWKLEPTVGNGSGWTAYVSDQMKSKKWEGIAKIGNVMRDVRDRWGQLSDYDKERFKSQGEIQAAQKKRERDEWTRTYSPERIYLANLARAALLRKHKRKALKIQDDRIPKRPLSACSRFYRDWFQSTPEGQEALHSTDRFKLAGHHWTILSEAEKLPYVKEFQEDMARFNEESASFRKKVEELRELRKTDNAKESS